MLELLIGMVASGKSTYARKRADQGALVVNHDDLTEMLHARYRYEPGLRDSYRAMMLHIAHVGVISGRNVVIDRTHLTRESRRLWLDAATAWMVPIIAVEFPISHPDFHALQRFEADARGRSYEDWIQVARHHFAQATEEPLGDDEGFDGLFTFNGTTCEAVPRPQPITA